MKKIISMVLLILLAFMVNACEPTTTQISMNTNLTQSTTTQSTTTNTTYIPVTFIDIQADMQEVCQAAIITLNVDVVPANATNQNYTITMPTNSMLTFVSGTNNMQVEVTGNPPGGVEIDEVWITVTSDDNNSLTNTVRIFVYSDSYSPPQCQLN